MHNRNLFGVPTPSARLSDPSTSDAAARSITTDGMHASQRIIYSVLREMGSGSDTDIYNAICGRNHLMSPSRARTARGELVAMGLVRDSGGRVRLSSGCWSIVWEVAR